LCRSNVSDGIVVERSGEVGGAAPRTEHGSVESWVASAFSHRLAGSYGPMVERSDRASIAARHPKSYRVELGRCRGRGSVASSDVFRWRGGARGALAGSAGRRDRRLPCSCRRHACRWRARRFVGEVGGQVSLLVAAVRITLIAARCMHLVDLGSQNTSTCGTGGHGSSSNVYSLHRASVTAVLTGVLRVLPTTYLPATVSDVAMNCGK
jgi:hypothetical protein